MKSRKSIFLAVTYLFLGFTTIFQPVRANAQKLVLYFPFEGSGDKVDDKSGQNNHGKFDNGKAKRVASKDKPFGKAMEFEKARIIVKESKSLTDLKEISFVMWANKFTEPGGNGTLPRMISRAGDKHELAMDSGHMQKGNFALYAGGITGWNKGMPVKEKQWHHIVVTYDGKVFDMYLDGKLQRDYQIKAPGKLALTGPLYVGSRHTGLGEDYFGLLDELAVYSGVLGEKKIKEIMENGVLDQFAVDAKRKLASTWGEIKNRL